MTQREAVFERSVLLRHYPASSEWHARLVVNEVRQVETNRDPEIHSRAAKLMWERRRAKEGSECAR